jgi:hypothetical protein
VKHSKSSFDKSKPIHCEPAARDHSAAVSFLSPPLSYSAASS